MSPTVAGREAPDGELANRVAWAVWVVTFVLFLPASRFDFVDYDDLMILFEQPRVCSGLSWGNLAWAFGTLHADFAYWMPLTWFSHQLDFQFFGDNPGAHHLTNVLLHATNSLLLFRAFYRATSRLWCSASVAMLFAWHPLHVESVAWVAERKSLVCAFFWMLTLHAYLRYVAARTWRNYTLVFVGVACALMGKPMAVTLPFSLLLLDFWPLARFESSHIGRGSLWRRWSPLVIEKVPLLSVSMAGSILAYVAQHQVGAVREELGLAYRIQTALAGYWLYVRKTFWPADLIPIYERHPWPTIPVVMGGILFVVASSLCLRWRQHRPWLLMGWLWYLGNLVPSIGIVQIGSHALADRYTYIPLIGVFVAVVWGVAELQASFGSSVSRAREVLFVAVASVLMALGICTSMQLDHWKNGVSLFRHAIEVAPWSSKAHSLLGMNLLKAGKLDEAVAHGKEALRLKPDRSDACVLIATALRKSGKLAEAKTYYEAVLERRPDDKHALAGLAFMLSGAESKEVRDPRKAVVLAKRLCDLTAHRRPRYVSILAEAYYRAGMREEAVRTAKNGCAMSWEVGDIRSAKAFEDRLRTIEGNAASLESGTVHENSGTSGRVGDLMDDSRP